MKDPRFFNGKLKGKRKETVRQATLEQPIGLSMATDVLKEAERAWLSLDEMRRKTARSTMFAFGDQWGDTVSMAQTGMPSWVMTERTHIQKQGRIPINNNMVRPIMKNIEGQFRQTSTKALCIARDPRKAELSEMCTIALEYIEYENSLKELDAALLTTLELSGVCAQRIEYNFNAAKQKWNVWVRNCNPFRLFYNTNQEDVRAWDTNLIGELFDVTYKDLAASFARNPQHEAELRRVYGSNKEGLSGEAYGMTGQENRNMSFGIASRQDLCRVILVWKKESRDAYFCHDYLTGKWWYARPGERAAIDAENRRRRTEAAQFGVSEEDMLLIEYEWEIEQYWYYRYMSPTGHVLKEGESPYWHKTHSYELSFYPLVHGTMHNFVEDLIDIQKTINRIFTEITARLSAGLKGLKVYDETMFPGMSPEYIADLASRYNGLLPAKLTPGKRLQDSITQLDASVNMTNDFQLVNTMLGLIKDVSGVYSAMQGQTPRSGTPAALYAQETQNAATNILGLMEAFKDFRLKRYNKALKTAQQFYESGLLLAVSGSNYKDESRYWNRERVLNADIDVVIAEGHSTPAYQLIANEFMMQLFQAGAIDVKQLLKNTSLPFASQLLEGIEAQEGEMMQQAQMQQAQMPQGAPAIPAAPAQQQAGMGIPGKG
jgi:hypothetical protein